MFNKSGSYAAGVRVSDPAGPLEGRCLSFHGNGQKDQEGEYKNGKEEGPWTYWNEEGAQLFNKSGIYSSGVRVSDPPAPLEGRWLTFHGNGQRDQAGEYKNGMKDGPWAYSIE